MTPLTSQDLEALKADLARWAQTFAVNQSIAIRTKADAEVCEEACDEISLAFDNACKAITALEAEKAEARRLALEEAAGVAKQYARALSKGTHPKAGSIEEIGERIEAAILALKERP